MKKVLVLVFALVGMFLIILGCYFGFKFKNVKFETGNSIELKDFIRFGSSSNTKMLTNLDDINCNDVGTYNIKIRYLGFKYNLRLEIVDTIPPQIEVQNVFKPLNYKFNINDFIVQNNENAKIDYETNADATKYGEYSVIIKASDAVGNTTKKEVLLDITWIKNNTIEIQLGQKLTSEMLFYNDEDINTISSDDIKRINDSPIGTYTINCAKNNINKSIVVVKIKDETPPNLILKNKKIYLGDKIEKNDFIVKATDNYSNVTTKLLTKIKNELGKQTIEIEAIDADGNKVVKTALLEIIKDNVGPVFNGLEKITIDKGTKIDFEKGVKAIDDKDGKCDFKYQSDIDINKHGTYYVTYTSVDKSGNKTTKKRVVVVNHDKVDTNNLVKEVASTLPNDVISIRNYVRTIKYATNDGGNDPVWYGLKNRSGNCIVHAYVFDELLKAKGYQTKVIWVTDKTHYWNMIYLNNKWVHMDSTPGVKHTVYDIMNDEMRHETLQGRNWERDKWPKADWE